MRHEAKAMIPFLTSVSPHSKERLQKRPTQPRFMTEGSVVSWARGGKQGIGVCVLVPPSSPTAILLPFLMPLSPSPFSPLLLLHFRAAKKQLEENNSHQ